MAGKLKAGRLMSLVIGLVLVAGAVYGVFFVEWKSEPEEEPTLIRPLKTMIVESPIMPSGGKYPGKVLATEMVDLAFQVGGPLIEFPVKKGDEVEKDQFLARIDPRDFENALEIATAEVTRTKAILERTERSAKSGAVSQTDLTNAKTNHDVAIANEKIAQKALDDTYLKAKFDGVIANTYVENFQNVQPKQNILSLQDVSHVDVKVAIPEARMASTRNISSDRYRFYATFDYLPEREFEVTIKEYATEADPLTQTYAVTLTMPAPEDVTILPGMTATVHEYLKAGEEAEGAGFLVPLDIVPVDGQGQYFVWTLKDVGDGTYSVHRTDVEVGEIIEDKVFVKSGLDKGDRIAAAGVHILQEEQRVRLLATRGGGDAR